MFPWSAEADAQEASNPAGSGSASASGSRRTLSCEGDFPRRLTDERDSFLAGGSVSDRGDRTGPEYEAATVSNSQYVPLCVSLSVCTCVCVFFFSMTLTPHTTLSYPLLTLRLVGTTLTPTTSCGSGAAPEAAATRRTSFPRCPPTWPPRCHHAAVAPRATRTRREA